MCAGAVSAVICRHRIYGTVNQTGSLKTGLALRTARPVNRLTVNIPNHQCGQNNKPDRTQKAQTSPDAILNFVEGHLFLPKLLLVAQFCRNAKFDGENFSKHGHLQTFIFNSMWLNKTKWMDYTCRSLATTRKHNIQEITRNS